MDDEIDRKRTRTVRVDSIYRRAYVAAWIVATVAAFLIGSIVVENLSFFWPWPERTTKGWIALAVISVISQLCALPLALTWSMAWGELVLRYAGRGRRHDVCQKCCYELTGNQSGRCPECGEPVAAPPSYGDGTHVEIETAALWKLRLSAAIVVAFLIALPVVF